MNRIPRPQDERWSDFRHFLADVWEYLNHPEPTWVQFDIARWLSHPNAPRRGITEAFRGVGKSWMTVAFVVWCLFWHPDWRILVVSASKSAADDFSTFALRLIREMPGLHHMEPRDGQRDSKIAFDVAESPPDKAPSVKSLGITSQLTGTRADLIVLDDIEIPSNSQTQAMRAKLAEQVKECDAILKPERHARTVVLGTPQCEQSVYNEMEKRGYVARIWPSRFPTPEEQVEYGTRLAPSITHRILSDDTVAVGHPTDPRRFTDMDLRERELSYGRSGFALQFQLRTKLSDAERYPLKVRDLTVMDCDRTTAPEKPIWCNDPANVMNELPNQAMNGDWFYRPMSLVGKWIPYSGIVMAIDPAGRGTDETGYAIVAMLNGYLYVLACGGLQGGYDESVLRQLAELAKAYHVKHVVIEANFGDGMFSKLMEPAFLRVDYPVTVEEVKHSIQKEKRILDTLEPLWQSHRLVFDSRVIEQDYLTTQGYGLDVQHTYSVIYQATRLTKEKGCLRHDDRLDVLSIACAYWVEQMNADADTEQEARRITLLDQELARFMAHATGATEQTLLWTDYMR